MLYLFDAKVISRFNKNCIVRANGCIDYLKGIDSSGYGRISIGSYSGRVRILAHRWSMMLSLGVSELPDDLLCCHTCDNRCCVNIKHLFLGTNKDNSVDMVSKGRSVVMLGNAKLSWEIVDDIRSSELSGVELMKKYNIGSATVSDIRNNKRYREELRGIGVFPKSKASQVF